jgi:hypothetical protein
MENNRSGRLPQGEELADSTYLACKTKFEEEVRVIQELRTVERLTRVVPREEREAVLARFRGLYMGLKESLERVKVQAATIKDRQQDTKGPEEPGSTVGHGASASEWGESLQCARVVQDVKAMEHLYRELFLEGSLKRLATVCKLTELAYDFEIDYDIAGWSEEIIAALKRKEKDHCCF